MDAKANLLETRWYQAENSLWLFDATGAAAVRKPGIQKTLSVTILRTLPARRFTLINKGHRIAILLPQQAERNKEKSKDTLRAANPGQPINPAQLPVTPAELAPGAAVLTRIEGTLVDPTRHFNARWFGRDLTALDSANPAQHAIGLFRHTQAIAHSVGGSLRGQLQLESGEPVPWAIVSLNLQLVAPPPLDGEEPAPAAPIVLVQTQANQFGDFVLPLNELPAAEFDTPLPAYNAQLRVQRCAIRSGLPDPDDRQNLTLLELQPAGDNAEFVASTVFQLRAGEHRQLHSHQKTALLVRPSG